MSPAEEEQSREFDSIAKLARNKETFDSALERIRKLIHGTPRLVDRIALLQRWYDIRNIAGTTEGPTWRDLSVEIKAEEIVRQIHEALSLKSDTDTNWLLHLLQVHAASADAQSFLPLVLPLCVGPKANAPGAVRALQAFADRQPELLEEAFERFKKSSSARERGVAAMLIGTRLGRKNLQHNLFWLLRYVEKARESQQHIILEQSGESVIAIEEPGPEEMAAWANFFLQARNSEHIARQSKIEIIRLALNVTRGLVKRNAPAETTLAFVDAFGCPEPVDEAEVDGLHDWSAFLVDVGQGGRALRLLHPLRAQLQSSSPRWFEVQLLTAAAHLAEGDARLCVSECESAISEIDALGARGESFWAIRSRIESKMGDAHLRLGHIDEALTCYTQSLREIQEPDRWSMAIETKDTALEWGIGTDAVHGMYARAAFDRHLGLGRALLSIERARDALDVYQAALRLQPAFLGGAEDPRVYFGLGAAWLACKDQENALAAYAKGFGLHEKRMNGHARLSGLNRPPFYPVETAGLVEAKIHLIHGLEHGDPKARNCARDLIAETLNLLLSIRTLWPLMKVQHALIETCKEAAAKLEAAR